MIIKRGRYIFDKLTRRAKVCGLFLECVFGMLIGWAENSNHMEFIIVLLTRVQHVSNWLSSPQVNCFCGEVIRAGSGLHPAVHGP